MNEIWKDVIGYEGLYQVSNLGNIKSLNYNKTKKEKLLALHKNGGGYLSVVFYKNKKAKTQNVHQIVAIAFLNHTPCGHKLVIDHINDNKLDNRLENLQVVTQMENAYKTQGKYSSQYKGVSWHKVMNKWCAYITINKKLKTLGYFNSEDEANETRIKTFNEFYNEK